jgi:nickel-dependent lactate racemase
MDIKLAYGKKGLNVLLPADLRVSVIEPQYIEGIQDPVGEVAKALTSPIASPPLKKLASERQKIGIVVNDITRPTPYELILPVILRELDSSSSDIIIFVALGSHRENSEEELRSMLGDDIVDHYRIVQNNCSDKSTQARLCVSSQGHEIWINRRFLDCDLKILTGFIEPHFFAGFSGGGKAVFPGMAGLDTIMNNHSTGMIDHSRATWAVTKGNPIWEEVHEVALMAGDCFLVNVTLNREKKITAVFAGDLAKAHIRGCEFVKKVSMVSVKEPFDIIITSNSGYPLDLNLYQCVKGMSAAGQVVKTGGSIIIAADCWDGIPEHGEYGRLLGEAESPSHLLQKIRQSDTLKQDQWQVQIQARLQEKADIYVRSDNLTPEQIQMALLKPSSRIEDTVDELLAKYGREAKICVLPEGPQTIPYIAQ